MMFFVCLLRCYILWHGKFLGNLLFGEIYFEIFNLEGINKHLIEITMKSVENILFLKTSLSK